MGKESRRTKCAKWIHFTGKQFSMYIRHWESIHFIIMSKFFFSVSTFLKLKSKGISLLLQNGPMHTQSSWLRAVYPTIHAHEHMCIYCVCISVHKTKKFWKSNSPYFDLWIRIFFSFIYNSIIFNSILYPLCNWWL